MRSLSKPRLGIVLIAVLLSTPVLALGPVDGEIGAVWWANEFDSDGGAANVSSDAGAPGFFAQLWFFDRFGLKASQYTSDLDDVGADSADYTSVDAMWRPFSPSENNFIALGLGWEEMDLASIGLDGDTSGARVTVEGRIAVAVVYFYGQGSYLPKLDDTPATVAADGVFEDLSSLELEAGVAWKVAPFIGLRGGYRSQKVDFTRIPEIGPELEGEVDSNGFFAGLNFRF
jgi:opacity protein-like surface antigen